MISITQVSGTISYYVLKYALIMRNLVDRVLATPLRRRIAFLDKTHKFGNTRADHR